MTVNLTREQLYDLVWSEPMQRLSKQIGISDVAIAKHCRKIGVPVPERGYWAKLQAGQPVKRTPLPERDLATARRVSMSGTLPPELRAHIKGEPGIADGPDDDIELLTARFRKRLGTVTVPRNFAQTHPAVATLLRKDEQYRQERERTGYGWPEPQFETPFERRRLQFLNGLFLGFEKVGGSPLIRGSGARELGIYIGNASVTFELDKVRHTANRRCGELPAPEGREKLRLTVSGNAADVPTCWEDQEGNPLEKQVTEVIVGMLIAGEHFHRRWLTEQAAWERQRREEAERAAIKRKEDEERREREASPQSRKPDWIRSCKPPRDGAPPRTFATISMPSASPRANW